MKKSFVAMVLILALCLSQFLIGNAEGKAIDLIDKFVINDEGSFVLENVDEGLKITAADKKGEWSYVKADLEGNMKEYTQVRLVVQGTKDVQILLKVEGTNDEYRTKFPAKENWVTMTGEEQEIVWDVPVESLTDSGNQMFMIFLNAGPGKTGCNAENPENVTVKYVKLCTPDYVEPVEPTPAPETGDSFNMVPAVMMVLAAFVFVVAYAKKREMI